MCKMAVLFCRRAAGGALSPAQCIDYPYFNSESGRMSKGLYSLDEFRDNCGFGLIAHMHGEASHTLLRSAINALTCMTHRGGIAADGKTGDGCGLLLKKPDSFL